MKKSYIFLFFLLICLGTAEAREQLSFIDSCYIQQFRGEGYSVILNQVLQDIRELNSQFAENKILPGDLVKMPVGIKPYRVKNGDSMYKIAKTFTETVVIPFLDSSASLKKANVEESNDKKIWTSIVLVLIFIVLKWLAFFPTVFKKLNKK